MTINRRKELISADPNQPQTNSETNSETRHLDLNISICLIWFPYLLYADYNCWQRSTASTENKLTLHRVLPDPACWRSQYKAVIMGKLQWWTASTVIPWQFHLPNSHSCLRRVNIVTLSDSLNSISFPQLQHVQGLVWARYGHLRWCVSWNQFSSMGAIDHV